MEARSLEAGSTLVPAKPVLILSGIRGAQGMGSVPGIFSVSELFLTAVISSHSIGLLDEPWLVVGRVLNSGESQFIL